MDKTTAINYILNEHHKKQSLYRLNKPNALFNLCEAYDYAMAQKFILSSDRAIRQKVGVDLFNNAYQALDRLEFHYRDSFRNMIKFIFKSCPDGELSLSLDEPYFVNFNNELTEMIDFNVFRNVLERYKIGKISLNYDESTNTFDEINLLTEQESYAEIYNRLKGKRETSIPSKNLLFIVAYLFNPINQLEFLINCKVIENGTRLVFSKSVFDEVYKFCYKSMEFPSDFEAEAFIDYKIDDYFKVLGYLEAEAVLRIKFYLLNYKDTLFQIPNIQYDTLVNEMCDYFKDLTKERIEEIIGFLTYDYEFEKEKTAIFEPIFKMDGQVFYSAFAFIYSELVDKILYKFTRVDEKLETRNNNLRAVQMENEYAALFAKTSRLKVNHSFRFKHNGETKEYDVCVYDSKTQMLLVVELKWYNRIEGERDNFANEKKLEAEIDRCVKREEIIKRDVNIFTQRAFGESVNVKSIKSIIISEGFLPIKTNMSGITILDDNIFKSEWSMSKEDVAVFIRNINSKNLLKKYCKGFTREKHQYKYGGFKLNALIIT